MRLHGQAHVLVSGHLTAAENLSLRPDRVRRWVEYALQLALPLDRQDDVIGDLMERYADDWIPQHGMKRARLLLLRHALSCVIAAFHLRRWAAIGAALRAVYRYFL